MEGAVTLPGDSESETGQFRKRRDNPDHHHSSLLLPLPKSILKPRRTWSPSQIN